MASGKTKYRAIIIQYTKFNKNFPNLSLFAFDSLSYIVFLKVPELRWMLLIYALCIAFGSIGNIVTLITMATADRKTKSVTNIFLISLAVSNINKYV